MSDAVNDNAAPILEISDLSAGYDNVPVIRGLTLSVGAGEVVALLGANGAGKTTTLRAISGLVKTSTGTMKLAGSDLDGDCRGDPWARDSVDCVSDRQARSARGQG